MKFNERFPEHVKPPQTLGPHPEVDLGPLSQSWRVYACMVCHEPTSWRWNHEDLPGTPVCSEECLGVAQKWARPPCESCQHLLHEDPVQTRCLASDKEGAFFCDCTQDHRKSPESEPPKNSTDPA